MARIAGVKLHKTATGKIKAITFDLKKHGALLNPYLKKIGIVEENVSEEDDDFDRKFKNGFTREEVLKRVFAHIDTLPWKK